MKKFDFLSNLLQRVSAMSGMRAETINYDGQPAVNRRANMTSVLRHCKASDVRVAREWLQKSSARVAQGLRKSVRFAATILVLLWIGVGNVWGASVTFTSSSDYSSFSGGSLTKNEVTVSGFGSVQASDLRLYKGAKLTISATSNITALSFTFTNGSNNGGWNGSSNSYSVSGLSTTSWNKSATSGSSGKQARITQIVVTYLGKVTFNANEGSCATSNLTQATANSSITLPTPNRSGFTCTGWYTASSGGTKRGNVGDTYTPTVSETLYAQWEADVPAYTITAARNNDSYGNVSLSGTTITATPAACCEYASPAYTVSPAGSATVSQVGNAFTVTPSANTTVTINFQEKSAGKTVNFDAGAGVCATTSLTEDCDGSGIVLPNVTASGVCKGWTTFAGWRTSAIATADSTTTNPGTLYAAGSTYYPSSNGETLYAVFSKTKGGGTTPTEKPLTFGTTYASNGSDLTSVTIYTGITATATEGTTNNPKYYTTSPGTWRMYSGSELTISSSIGNITKIEFTKSSDFNLSVKSGESGTLSSETWTYASGVSSITFNVGGTTKLSAIAVTYLAPSSTTYYCSDPNCCTPLGTINGSVSLTQLATSDPTKLKATWAMNAETGIASYTLEVYNSSNTLVKTINNYTSGSEITGLTPCTEYYVKLYTVSSGSPYCEGGLIGTSSSCTTNSYNVTFPILTGTTKLTGNATACASGNYVATFEAANEAYELPTASGVTVTIGGSPATSGTDYTWAVSEGVGTLTIPTAKQTGDITIAVVSVAHSCSATPTLGAASLSGAFSLSSVGISCAGITPVSYCAVESGDYGFIWYEGTASDKKIGDTGVTKIAISTGDYSSGSFSTALSSTFVAGNTYTFRAFATNTGENTGYSAESSFTPRSVTFDSNGGSAVATAYVNSGSTVSQPSAPTRTGYDFVKWQLNGADYSFSSAVNANITLDAVWDAKSYTVTLDQQSGSGGSENVSATYDADMPSATMPTRSGYTFGGYYGSEGGAGTQYYAADGSSAHTWDVADAKTLYAQWTAKNYTITLNNEGADSGKEGTESISVTFDANTNLTSAITKPVKDGYKFGGYYTEEDGSGTQIIDENGNVNASVTSYTSAIKQWIYANNIELHAYWKPSYTVTWSVNGETTTEQVVSGEQVAALPAAPTSSDCDDAKVFVGWRSTEIDGVSAANPGSIFTTQAASPAITGNTTFYAVFADEGKATRTTLYSEPFTGTCGTNTAWASASSYFYNASTASITTTTNWQVSKYTTNPSDNDGASGGSHMLCGSSDKDIVFDFGDKSSYVDLQLSFNFKNEAGKNTNRTIGCYVSGDDGESWTSNLISVSTIQDQDWHACSYNISNGSTGALQVKFSTLAANASRVDDITLTGCAKTYSNYVTSCSSCDADATFTNTTPEVSAIDCDAATLTATDGLATLGADGCNVSDYGFVIGTTDNPTIGGVGVNKLQVGTTNPTIGADFSYDATGLTKGTHYYIRAYATNRHGTVYSGSQNFWTKGVRSIAITTAPTKTKYVEGETFDKTGMVVTATMADGSTEDVTSDCTFSPSLSTKLSDQTAVRATYSLCEVDKTADQAIDVYTLTVTEGTNDTYGTAGKTDNKVTVTGLGDHKTYTVTVTSGNADKIDNGDGTYTITNATGNVTVRVDYADAVQVKVYYKVDGVTVTGLTQNVYQSETTTLPTASELATEMTAQGMDIPDDSYPNFVGWSETEFGAQTSEPTLVTGTPTINAEKIYYAVYTNLNVIRLDKTSTGVSTSYPSASSADASITVGGKGFKVNYLIYQNETGGVNPFLQFKKDATYYGRIYNSDALSNILKVVVAYKNADSNVKVYACSAAGTISGDAITAGTRGATDPYVYTMPANTQYLMVRGDNGTAYKTYYIDIYYASATVEYMTQFCTRYDITGVTKSGTAVTGGTLSSNYNSACEGKSVELEAVVSTGYQFNGWTIKKTADLTQDVTSTLLGANASSLTPPAFSMPAYAITVSASITEKELTGWTWKQALPDESIAIPSKVVLYVGQRAEFDLIEYDPSDVLAKKKGYGVAKEDAYLTQNAKAADYYKADAKAAVESTTLTLTSTSNSSVQEVINIQIKALPSVTFEDHVHSVVFSAVAATIGESDKRVVYLTKTTPTTSDFSGTTYNTCEEQHEHLVGWIESGWADEHPNATHSEIAGAGADVFYTAGASIDVEAQNGKTFYAVWSKIE